MNIDDNELTVIKKKIITLCEKLENVDDTVFGQPANEGLLKQWELNNCTIIPEIYKKWLLITGYSYICGGILELFMPSLNGYYGQLVPENYVVIGNIIGDGERVCFEKNTGKFIRYDHGKIKTLGDFSDLLYWTIEYLELILNVATEKVFYVNKEDLLRRKAIQEFWVHERELLSNGQCTRQWNFYEIECIYNISTVTGNKRNYAGKPIEYDLKGNKIVDENGTPIRYEGHCMMSCDEYPEYIGNWKNIQALTPKEHMLGAHRSI